MQVQRLRNNGGWKAVCLLLVLAVWGSPTTATAQLLYSFESGLEGWTPTGFDGTDYISHSQSSSGASHGNFSMAVKRGELNANGHSWDVNIGTVPPGPVRDLFLEAAANPEKYALDFDVTLTSQSFANVTQIPPFFGIMVSVNGSASGENNFDAVENLVPVGGQNNNLMDANPSNPAAGIPRLGTHHYSVPLADAVQPGTSGLYLVPDSEYYQLNIGSNLTASLFNAPPGEGATYYVDNIHFRRLPDRIPETLFSFETPDDEGTMEVDEQFEGWAPGFQPGHSHAITTTGVTDGESALNIHRVYTGQDFTWGSQMPIAGNSPENQARINELTSKIEGADRVALDVTFNPAEWDASPTYTTIAMHFSDTANFFDASFPFISTVNVTGETTVTLELPLSAFETDDGINLAEVGFVENTTFFRMGVSTSVDGLLIEGEQYPVDYQIDNIRLIREVFPNEGDYNADGIVDAADYVAFKKFEGTTHQLPNDPNGGTIGPPQYASWKSNFGAGTAGGGAAVPEPGAAVLAFMGIALAPSIGRLVRAQR
jgi:hypothetical protein